MHRSRALLRLGLEFRIVICVAFASAGRLRLFRECTCVFPARCSGTSRHDKKKRQKERGTIACLVVSVERLWYIDIDSFL